MKTDATPRKTGRGTHVLLTLNAEQLAKIDAMRGIIPRATFILDLAMRAAATR